MDHTAYRHALSAQLAQSELPFAPEEFTARLARTRAAMRDAGIDALLLTDPADIFYLTGYHTFEVSVHTALIVSTERLVLQVPSIETGPAVVTALVDEIIGYLWEDIDAVIDPLAELLAPYQAIGLDLYAASLRHGVIRALQSRLGAARFRDDGGALVDGLRLVKTEAELACLRESARITSAALRAAEAVVQAGTTDNAIAAEGARALLAEGSEFMSLQPIVTSARRIGTIHVNHKRHVIAPDAPVFLEFGAAFQRYTAPMMRTVVAGKPTDQMRRIADLCRAIFEALGAEMRPGRSFDDAARAADAVLSPHADALFFSGVFGYAVGAQFPPSWVEGTGYIARGQTRRFEPGMVFHLPLCLRLPGQWGIGLSDTVLVTEGGAVPITDNSWQLG
ncbi:aminopeptidase P family protein [Rhodobacteraceae bacterium 2376]|uniref:Aminopeptidase P family protein n=1 Tax=Rhabdonatronobacter sediminivivens TaxID=2743469 RepID=A0A7Z0HZG6_9RHOB|nr:M24 family metallopeptidase [Rhabdonatronobacter sediminivivens]NYS25060.1 aminopeptidase P family protein [Rhabdonatronobacter sediminivivens]